MMDAQVKEALQEYQFSQKRIQELKAFIDEQQIQGIKNKNIKHYVLINVAKSLISFLELRMKQREPLLTTSDRNGLT